jgi:hypothetical protein
VRSEKHECPKRLSLAKVGLARPHARLTRSFLRGADAWKKFIVALSKLPPEFKVLGINDYIFLDGYKKVVAAKAAGKLPNIDLLLPVIELRLDKFGGGKSGLSRVNYHVIFSNENAPKTIESQFLSALCSKYVLSPGFDNLRTSARAQPSSRFTRLVSTASVLSVRSEQHDRARVK